LEKVTLVAAGVAFGLLSVGLLTGLPGLGWGDVLGLKVVLALLAWAALGGASVGAIWPWRRGPRSAVLSVAGFGLTVAAVAATQWM
jgi:hypothetical protein